MEKLVVLKVEGDELLVCGFFNSKEDVVQYLTAVNKMINEEMQQNLQGEYIAIPALYYQLTQQISKKK